MITRFNWKVKMSERLGESGSYMTDMKEILKELLNWKTYKGYRLFIGRGTYHVSSSSTRACNELLKEQEVLRLVKGRKFK